MKHGEIDHQGFRVSVVRHVLHVNRAATISHSRDADQIRIQRAARSDIDDDCIVGTDRAVCQRKRNLGTWRKLGVAHRDAAASLVQRHTSGFTARLSNRAIRAVGVAQLLRSVDRCALDGLGIGGANNAAINVLVEERDPDWFCEAHLKTPSSPLPLRHGRVTVAFFADCTPHGAPQETQTLRTARRQRLVTPAPAPSCPSYFLAE